MVCVGGLLHPQRLAAEQMPSAISIKVCSVCKEREKYLRSVADSSSVPKCDWKKSLPLGNRRRSGVLIPKGSADSPKGNIQLQE